MKNVCLSAICMTLVIFFQSACATIVTGTFQGIDIESSPSGAEVFVNGNSVGVTPCEVDLDQATEPYIVLKKEGYADTRVKLRKGLNGWLCLNVFTGIVPGLIVDKMAGVEKSFNEDDICVPLLLHGESRMSFYDGNVTLINASEE